MRDRISIDMKLYAAPKFTVEYKLNILGLAFFDNCHENPNTISVYSYKFLLKRVFLSVRVCVYRTRVKDSLPIGKLQFITEMDKYIVTKFNFLVCSVYRDFFQHQPLINSLQSNLFLVNTGCYGCREQSEGGKSVLAHDDDGHLRDGTCQSCDNDLPEVTPASLQHAQQRRGGQIRRFLRKGQRSSLSRIFIPPREW